MKWSFIFYVIKSFNERYYPHCNFWEGKMSKGKFPQQDMSLSGLNICIVVNLWSCINVLTFRRSIKIKITYMSLCLCHLVAWQMKERVLKTYHHLTHMASTFNLPDRGSLQQPPASAGSLIQSLRLNGDVQLGVREHSNYIQQVTIIKPEQLGDKFKHSFC